MPNNAYPQMAVQDLSPEDELGFAIPKTPSHSLQLLNRYMRTDLLRSIHQHIHQMRDAKQRRRSPLEQLAKSLERVIGAFDGVNLFECVAPNPYHLDPCRTFNPEPDYAHDIKLMKHHLACHRKTIKELRRMV